MQYAISFSDVMSTYGPIKEQDNFFIEGIAVIINAEVDKGSSYVSAVYINNKPMVLVFDDGKQQTAVKKLPENNIRRY